MKTHDKVKEPLFHIVKRDGLVWWRSWIVRIVAVLVALLFSGVVSYLLTGVNPMKIYATMIDGAFGTPRRTWNLLHALAMLLCVSIAVTPAFKMRFWNIGAEGQALIGGFVAAACMLKLTGVIPDFLIIPVMLLGSILAGAVWGVIPAIFKAKWGTNETLFTLMMNYIAAQIVKYFVYIWAVPAGSGKIGIINGKSYIGWLPELGGSSFAGKKYLLGIIIVLALTVFMYIYLKYSKQGYEISVVGESENTARYIGINVKKVIIRTMIISGALCGIAGFLLVSGADHSITAETIDGRGFTAIMVSWLAKFNPIVMVVTSFILAFFEKGASEIATSLNLNQAFSDIITGIIIFFIIGSEFFINYRIKFREKEADTK
ncbi:MAG: ABC transporter permease [Clostridia bacterium]|nr:ABC transporter permease [Clostridia bacterium]MBQ6614119.1 ABC transporter permease [Clostridia bacterium]